MFRFRSTNGISKKGTRIFLDMGNRGWRYGRQGSEVWETGIEGMGDRDSGAYLKQRSALKKQNLLKST